MLAWLGPSNLQQPLDEAVEVEFIRICHRRPAARPPAGAALRPGFTAPFPPAKSTEAAPAVVAETVGGSPLTARSPASSFSPHWNHEAELCF